MAMNKYLEASLEFTHALSLDNNVQEAYKYRAECSRELVKTTEDKAKKEEYIACAEADEKKYDELNK